MSAGIASRRVSDRDRSNFFYDITDIGPSGVRVTLTYDGSAVSPVLREHIGFPPFEPGHLENSLQHLSDLAASA